MPTSLPRLQIAMPQELYDAVTDLAELTRQSKARVLLDVLEPATPYFREIAQLIRNQEQLKAEPALQLQSSLQSVMERMTTGVPMTDKASALLLELVQELQAAEEAEASTPRPVTRGVKSSPPLSPPSSPSLSSPLKTPSRH